MVHLHIKVGDQCEKVITLIVLIMECQVTQSFDCEDHGLLWTRIMQTIKKFSLWVDAHEQAHRSERMNDSKEL